MTKHVISMTTQCDYVTKLNMHILRVWWQLAITIIGHYGM